VIWSSCIECPVVGICSTLYIALFHCATLLTWCLMLCCCEWLMLLTTYICLALSCIATSISLHLYLKPAVHMISSDSFPRYSYLWSCDITCSACSQVFLPLVLWYHLYCTFQGILTSGLVISPVLHIPRYSYFLSGDITFSACPQVVLPLVLWYHLYCMFPGILTSCLVILPAVHV